MKSQRQLKAHHDITETRGFPSMEPISTPAPRTMTRVRSEDGLGKTCCASYRILRTETKKTLNLRDSEKECKSEQYWTILHTWISEANWCSKIRWLRSRDRSRIPHLWRALSREVVNWRPRDLDAEIGQSHGFVKRTENSENGETWHRTRGSMEVPFAPRSIPRSLKCPDLSRNSVNSIAWEVVWQKSRTKTSYIHTQILNADEMSSCIANCYVWSCLFQDLRVHFLGARGGYFMVAEFRTAGLGSSSQGPRFVDPELFQYDSMLGIHWITQHHRFLEVSIIIFDDFWSTGIFWQGRLFAFHLEAQHAEGRGVSLYAGRCSRWQ